MSVRISLEGSKELQAALRDMSDDVRNAVNDAVVGTAVELRGDVIQSVQNGPASGRTYQKYKPRRVHTASAPGQPPMSDTGRLASSIYFTESFGARRGLEAQVGSNVVYARYLEYGTSRMAARPFFRPAVEEMRAKFQSRLEAAVSGATR